MKTKLNIWMVLVLVAALVGGNTGVAQAAIPAYTEQGSVNLAPASPLLTAVDPYAKPDRPNPLNPERPYLYTVDQSGLTVLRMGTNAVLASVAWPATYDLALPDNTVQEDVPAPSVGWEPVRLMVPFPDGEGIGPEAVSGATTLAFVVMAHSGYEWQSSDGISRDMIALNTDPEKESSLLLMVDVSDPMHPLIHAGALLGHEAGQMAWDPSAGAMFVANMPSKSLPATLESFVSKITPPETGAEPAPPYSPNTFYPLCGPEIQWSGEAKVVEKMGIPVNVPEVWACDALHGAGEGEGPFTYLFEGLPTWLIPHGLDPLTGEADGILYGTPTEVGIYSFKVTVTDHAPEANGAQASAVFTIEVKPSVTEFAGGELEVEAGITTALPVWATDDSSCQAASGLTPVPAWFEVVTVPHGCILLMNNPPLSGEYYNFVLPNLSRIDTRSSVAFPGPWEVSAEVLGTYGFDSLPAGVGLSGLAWHEVDMIPGEPDKYNLNGEFIGVDAFTGQLWNIVPPYEASDTIEELPPDSLSMVISTNEVMPELAADGITPLTLSGSGFGNVVVEADRDIFVAAAGAVIKVSGGTASTITVPGTQASYLALDSDLEPAVTPDMGGLGQVDHGALWVTNPSSGDVTVIDTTTGTVNQTLSVAGATSLGGVSVDSVSTGLAYVAVPSAGTVTLFGSSADWPSTPMLATINPAEAIVDPTVMTVGELGSVTIIATGWPTPSLSLSDPLALPPGITFTDNGNGTATVSGTPTAAGIFTLTATATNAAGSASQAFTLTVDPLSAPTILSAAETTFLPNIAAQFQVQASGTPTPVLSLSELDVLPAGVFFQDNHSCSPLPAGADTGTITGPECTGSAFLGGIPTDVGVYYLTITASNSQGSATQGFYLNISNTGTPVIISANTAVFRPKSAGSFTVIATGAPMPTLTASGALPAGVTFTDNGNATATLAGNPTVQGIYPLTIKAANNKGLEATQAFTLVVDNMPAAATEVLTNTALPEPSEALALNPKTGTVYAMTGDNEYEEWVPNGVSPKLTVLDTDGKIVTTIPVERDSEYMAVNATTNRLYVPQWDRSREVDPNGTDDQKLLVINTQTNTAVATIAMPKPAFSAFKFYPVGVAVDEANNILFVGATTAEAEASEEEGGDPAELPGYILAFDGKNNSYLGYVQAGKNPESMVFNPAAKKVYVANEDEGTLTVVPTITRNKKGGWNTALPWSAQTPTTTGLLFPDPACQSGDEVRPFGEADKMVVDPLMNRVYVTDDAYQVAEVSADGSIRRLSINVENCGTPNAANNLAIAVNRGAMVNKVRQGILYVTTESNLIYVIDLKTFKVVGSMVVNGAHHNGWPVITNNSHLFITDEGWSMVTVYNLKDGLTP